MTQENPTIKIASVQMGVELKDPEANLARMVDLIQEATSEGAQIIVFPECVVTGYCLESREEAAEVAQPIPGPATERITACLQDLDETYVAFGLVEQDGDQLFNAVQVVGPTGLMGSYRKVHLPYVGLDRWIDPGDRPFEIIETPLVKLGINICYDGGFPEPSRVLTLQGAELIILPTNWPEGAENFARHVINARALENTVYYLSADRVGTERGTRFIGLSKICGLNGNTLAEAGEEEETILYATIDPEPARTKQIVRVPGKHVIDRIKDRRPDFYGDILE